MYRDTGAQGHTVGKGLFVVQIPGAYHLQKALLRHPDLVAVMGRGVGRIVHFGKGFTVDVADFQMDSRQAIVHHQGVPVQNGILHHRDFGQDLLQVHRPGNAGFQATVIAQSLFNATHRNILVEHRAHHPGSFQPPVFLLKGSCPQDPQGSTQSNGGIVGSSVDQHLLFAAEQVKNTG